MNVQVCDDESSEDSDYDSSQDHGDDVVDGKVC